MNVGDFVVRRDEFLYENGWDGRKTPHRVVAKSLVNPQLTMLILQTDLQWDEKRFRLATPEEVEVEEKPIAAGDWITHRVSGPVFCCSGNANGAYRHATAEEYRAAMEKGASAQVGDFVVRREELLDKNGWNRGEVPLRVILMGRNSDRFFRLRGLSQHDWWKTVEFRLATPEEIEAKPIAAGDWIRGTFSESCLVLEATQPHAAEEDYRHATAEEYRNAKEPSEALKAQVGDFVVRKEGLRGDSWGRGDSPMRVGDLKGQRMFLQGVSGLYVWKKPFFRLATPEEIEAKPIAAGDWVKALRAKDHPAFKVCLPHEPLLNYRHATAEEYRNAKDLVNVVQPLQIDETERYTVANEGPPISLANQRDKHSPEKKMPTELEQSDPGVSEDYETMERPLSAMETALGAQAARIDAEHKLVKDLYVRLEQKQKDDKVFDEMLLDLSDRLVTFETAREAAMVAPPEPPAPVVPPLMRDRVTGEEKLLVVSEPDELGRVNVYRGKKRRGGEKKGKSHAIFWAYAAALEPMPPVELIFTRTSKELVEARMSGYALGAAAGRTARFTVLAVILLLSLTAAIASNLGPVQALLSPAVEEPSVPKAFLPVQGSGKWEPVGDGYLEALHDAGREKYSSPFLPAHIAAQLTLIEDAEAEMLHALDNLEDE